MIRKSQSSGTFVAAVVLAATALIIQFQAPAQGPGSEPGPVAPAADDSSVAPGGYIPPSAERNRDDVVWLAPDAQPDVFEGGAYTATANGAVQAGKPGNTIEPGTYETRFQNGSEDCKFTVRTWNSNPPLTAHADETFTFDADESSAFSIEAGQTIFFRGISDTSGIGNGACPQEWIRLGEPGLVDFGIDIPDVADVEFDDDAPGIREFSDITPSGWYRSVGEVARGEHCAFRLDRDADLRPNLGDPALTHIFYGTDVEEMFVYIPPPFEPAPRNLVDGIHEGLYTPHIDHTRCPPDWQRQLD